MGSFPYVDIAIGLSFVYLLLALSCTTLNEMIASWWHTRANFLDRGITRLLSDPELKAELYKHPLINSMAEKSDKICPSYIQPRKFALALMDLLTGKNAANDPVALRAAVANHSNDHLRVALTAVLQDTAPGLVTDQEKIEAWFNDSMERVGGWYKRHTQTKILVLAIIVTLVANADTVKILRNLWANPSLRAEIVQRAQGRLEKGRPDETLPMVEYPDPNDPTNVKDVNPPDRDVISEDEKDVLSRLGGWVGEGRQMVDKEMESYSAWILKLLQKHLVGWILTILAVSLGAPFWFDMLNKFMNIRNAGRAPDERADKSRPSPTVPVPVPVPAPTPTTAPATGGGQS
jgi:hypothetical protein